MSKYSGLEATTELVTQLKAITGYKELLNTTDKSTLVNAVNELFDSIFDYTTTYIFYDSDIVTNTYGFAILECNNNILLAYQSRGGMGGGILYSTDYGATWQSSNITTGAYTVKKLISGTLLAYNAGSYAQYVYRSTDNGITWQQVDNLGYAQRTITEINTGKLLMTGYASTTDSAGIGIKYSTDSGATWQDSNITKGTSYNIIELNNNILVATANTSSVQSDTPAGIFYSTDTGTTWQQSNVTDSQAWYAYTFGSSNLVATNKDVGIKYSTDYGVTWQDSNITSTYSTKREIKVLNNSNTVQLLASDSSHLLYSTDNGVTWQNSTNMTGTSVSYYMTELQDGTLIYSSDTLKYSTDHGVTWHTSNITDYTWAVTELSNGYIVANCRQTSAGQGLLYSTDSGVTWQQSNIYNTNDLYTVYLLGNDLLMCNNASVGIKYSTDYGVTWQDTSVTTGQYSTKMISNGNIIATRTASGGSGKSIKYSTGNDIDPTTLKPKWETAIEQLAAQLNT